MTNDVSSSHTAVLETLGKAAAIFFGITYGIGFIVVSLHHARFGIVEFSLFKPRILLAGAVFMALAAVAALTAARSYKLLGLKTKHALVRPLAENKLDLSVVNVPLVLSLGLLLYFPVLLVANVFWFFLTLG